MNKIIKELLKEYSCKTPEEFKNAIKEVSQLIVLLALYRQNFFNNIAFYGGSALRITYGIDRFSEDLDFTLLKKEKSFSIDKYFKGIEEEFFNYGLDFKVEKKIKSFKSNIDSAFVKGNTLKQIFLIDGAFSFNKNDLIKIKIEIDTDPTNLEPSTNVFYSTKITPFTYRVLTKESLFSGKLHAILCRDYKSSRTKGRDLFDFIWYVNNNVSPNIKYLEEKLKQTFHLSTKDVLDINLLKTMLRVKFENINYNEAKKDVFPFIKNIDQLNLWSKDLFIHLVNQIN